MSFDEAVGGQDTFLGLVDRFYAGVVTDPVLAPMSPARTSLGHPTG